MGLLIRPDGSTEFIKGEGVAGDLTLDQIKRVLGDLTLTIAWIRTDPRVSGGYDHFYIDDEAKFKNLPINDEATRRCRFLFPDDYISGPALFCKSQNSKGRSY